MRKRLTVWFLVACLVLVPAVGVLANEIPPTLQALEEIETLLYGRVSDGNFLQRMEAAEKDLFGAVQTRPFLERLSSAYRTISGGGTADISVAMKLNVIEWILLQRLSEGPVIQRLATIESSFYGAPQQGSLFERIDSLMDMLIVRGTLKTGVVEIPAGQLVKIRTLTELNSGNSVEGSEFRYRVAEDVRINGRVVIPAGAIGVGQIGKVQSAAWLGRDGRVELDLGRVTAIDGSAVRLHATDKAAEKNKSVELAAGVTMAGLLILGPPGLAAGIFIRGGEFIYPIGTEMYVEVKHKTPVLGVQIGQ